MSDRVFSHMPRQLGDTRRLVLALFVFDNKAFGEVKICACRVRELCAHEKKGLRS